MRVDCACIRGLYDFFTLKTRIQETCSIIMTIVTFLYLELMVNSIAKWPSNHHCITFHSLAF
jgi:hypothetical protein